MTRPIRLPEPSRFTDPRLKKSIDIAAAGRDVGGIPMPASINILPYGEVITMSKFEVPVVQVRALEPIPGADFIELAVIGDYRSVVRKGSVKPGDLTVYLPEAALLPEYLINHLNLQGKLVGPDKNRVKATKLKKTVSQGIVLPFDQESRRLVIDHLDLLIEMGQNLAEPLGVVKYEPPVPSSMAGEVAALFGKAMGYDIENLKWYFDLLQPGEPVTITEKLHGTCCQFGFYPGLNHPELIGGDTFAASKGLGAKGLVFKNNEQNLTNLYMQAYRSFSKPVDGTGDRTEDLRDRLNHLRASGEFADLGLTMDTPVYLFGEVFGYGVQDLTYGLKTATFRGFDVYVGAPGQGRWLKVDDKIRLFAALGVEMVPFLYRGPWDKAIADQLKEGRTMLNGGACIREGAVITPDEERVTPEIGRLILKHVGDGYLTRKDGTEYT